MLCQSLPPVWTEELHNDLELFTFMTDTKNSSCDKGSCMGPRNKMKDKNVGNLSRAASYDNERSE
jgi:hypothetical protein